MLQNCSDTQKLFAKSVPVTIKDGYTNQCRSGKLFITVEWKEASAAVNKQELLVSLTDTNDPFFLYHLHLSEEDFQVLKSSQGLLIDFTAFPQKLINYIETCLAEDEKSTPKFILVFNTKDNLGGISPASQLDVVETNQFKHLIHLTLKFIAATDSSVKQHLVSTLKNLKEEKQRLENQLSYLEVDTCSKLSSSHATLELKSKELEKLRNEFSSQLSLKESKYARELQEERETFLNKQSERDARYESEKIEKECYYQKEIRQLEERVSCLDTLNKELSDQNQRRNSTVKELKSSVSSLEEEKRRIKECMDDCKEKSRALQSELKQKERELSLQQTRIGELASSEAYMKDMMEKLQRQYENNRDHEQALESELSALRKQFQEGQHIIEEQHADIAKGYDIIKKFQREIQDKHREFKSMQSHKAELQRTVSNKDKSIRTLQRELQDYKHDLGKRMDEVEDLSDSVISLQETISTLEKDIKTRDNVIQYLNRQLSEKDIIPQYMASSNHEQNAPINEKRHSAGDADVDSKRSPFTTLTDKPKTFSGRNGNSPSLQNNASSSTTQIPFDCAYKSTPSNNARNTRKILNSTAGNIELDSAALNAAFGAGNDLRPGTTKKLANPRTVGKTLRGRGKK